jgi:lactoylglutathione lyase
MRSGKGEGLNSSEPKDHGLEIRCYMRDPDGYIIEVGQTTGGLKDIEVG